MNILERINTALTTSTTKKYTGVSILAGLIALLGVSFGFVSSAVFLLTLAALVAAHEAGHLFVGKALGLPCVEYAVGFGPIVTSRQVRGIQVSLRAIPAGGYVRLGDDVDEATIPPLKRFLFAAAGPVASVAFGLVLLTAVSITEHGFSVGAFWFGLTSTAAVITSIAGAAAKLVSSAGSLFDFSASETTVTTPTAEPSVGLVGIGSLVDLFRAEIALNGQRAFYALAGSFSIVLGLFNGLPLPGLDGGHMAGAISTAITSRTAPLARFLTRRRVAKTIDGLRNGAIASIFAVTLLSVAWMFLVDPITALVQS